MRAPAGEDERVVGHGRAVDHELARREIDALDLAQQDARVLLGRQHRPDGVGDLGRREPGDGHLVEQGLEEVEVPPVDEVIEVFAVEGLRAQVSPPNPPPTISTRWRPMRRGF